MSNIRNLESQFEASTAQRIREIQARSNAVRRQIPRGATAYYLYEMGVALEAGALLAALHLSTSSVELFLREQLVHSMLACEEKRFLERGEMTRQEHLEQDRKMRFSDLIDRMIARSIFYAEDKDVAVAFYHDVRTPLAHGLLQRYVHGEPGLDDWPRFEGFTGQFAMEDISEDRSLDDIERAVWIIERTATCQAVLQQPELHLA